MKSGVIGRVPRISPTKGVSMDILGSGEKLTLVRIVAEPGAVIAEHSHPNEQIGTCVSGMGRLIVKGSQLKVEPGVCWIVESNESHSFIAEGGVSCVLVEAFSPPREDYLAMASRKESL